MRCLALDRLTTSRVRHYFRLTHEAQRAMFAVFDAHAANDDA